MTGEGREALTIALRRRLESEGYTVADAPDKASLPTFFGDYVPDAIATKPGMSIAIEVRERAAAPLEPRLQQIRELFDGRSDWQFRVYFTGEAAGVDIPAATAPQIRSRLEEVRALAESGHRREALVMGWSLLEASLQSLQPGNRPRSPGTIVDTLTMNGHVSYDTERKLRPLIPLRNRIVHGDLAVEPTEEDVSAVVEAVNQALTPKAA